MPWHVFLLLLVLAAVFWMVYGGTKKNQKDPSQTVVVSGYQYPAELIFSLFRLTLVDDYDYDVNELFIFFPRREGGGVGWVGVWGNHYHHPHFHLCPCLSLCLFLSPLPPPSFFFVCVCLALCQSVFLSVSLSVSVILSTKHDHSALFPVWFKWAFSIKFTIWFTWRHKSQWWSQWDSVRMRRKEGEIG